MTDDSLFTPIFWIYFLYILSFIIPLFCGITLLAVKGESFNKQAGMHPCRLLGFLLVATGLLFIPNIIQDSHASTAERHAIPALDIIIDLILIPLFFFYFRKLTKPEKLSPWQVGMHFIPAFVLLASALFIFYFKEKEYKPATFHYICLFVQTVMIVGYSIRVFKLKHQYILTLKDNYSSTEEIDLRWLNQAIPLAVFYAIIGLLASVRQTAWSDYLFYISSIVFVFYLFTHALNEPTTIIQNGIHETLLKDLNPVRNRSPKAPSPNPGT